jgi:hypothetical protein
MKIIRAITFGGLMMVAMSCESRAQQVTLQPGTALRIELDKRVRIRAGAQVSGHLTHPIYLVDHEVIPAGALVSGSIRSTHPARTKEHVRRLLAADFTPPRLPDIVFDSITIPAQGEGTSSTIAIVAPAEQTNASVLTLGIKPKKRSIKQQIGDQIGQTKRDVGETIKDHHYWEIVEKWAVGQLPYHPEIIWRKARFNADLSSAVDVRDTPHQTLATEDLHGHLPAGALDARLVSSLTSERAKRGDVVEAIVTKPLFSADGLRLVVPEGTHLFGKVVQVQAARRLGRNGSLRFSFSRLDLPVTESEQKSFEIHGHLSGAETAPGEHISMDEEGQAKASDSLAKYAEPALLAVLAAGAGPDDDHAGTAAPGAAGYSSNGFGLIARVVSLSTRDTNVIQGFAYYSLAKSLYFNFLDKGRDTTFPHDTEVQVTLSER